MANNDQLTNHSIKETIKDILYKEWASPDLLYFLDQYTAKSVNYSVEGNGDYGINLVIFDKLDVIKHFHFEFSEFVAKYWLSLCKSGPLCNPLPDDFEIVVTQKKDIFVILKSFTNDDIATTIVKKLNGFKYGYSINSDGNDTNIFCNLGEKYAYIHAYGS